MTYVIYGFPFTEKDMSRFFNRVEPTGFCWYWTGGITGRGYGNFSYKHSNNCLAHRVSYEFFIGKIPEDLVLDHLCRNTICVNPDHLEVVTQAVNNARRKFVIKSRCSRGHVRTPDTALRRENRQSHECKICHRDRERRSKGWTDTEILNGKRSQ